MNKPTRAPVATLVGCALGIALLWPALRWLFWDAIWVGTSYGACLDGDARKPGACWPAVWGNLDLLLVGRYPRELLWRPIVVIGLGVGSVLLPLVRRPRGWVLAGLGLVVFPIMWILMSGAPALSLAEVPTERWGGLALTCLLSMGAIVLSLIPGFLLALARVGGPPVFTGLATLFVEVIRGVPLIALLFVCHFLFPLFLPSGGPRLNEIVRALLALTVFLSAYSAEVWRGGFLALAKGQDEAAVALGLSPWQKLRHVSFPQVARVALPGLVATFIGLVKDTSLVATVGVLDLIGVARTIPRSGDWLGVDIEPLVFAGAVYAILGMSFTALAGTLEAKWKT